MQRVKGYKWVWIKKRSWSIKKVRIQQPIYEDVGTGASKDKIWFSLHRHEKYDG